MEVMIVRKPSKYLKMVDMSHWMLKMLGFVLAPKIFYFLFLFVLCRDSIRFDI